MDTFLSCTSSIEASRVWFLSCREVRDKVVKKSGKRSLTSGESTDYPTRSTSPNIGGPGHPSCYGTFLFNVASEDAGSRSADPRDESTGRRMPISIRSVNLCDYYTIPCQNSYQKQTGTGGYFDAIQR
jgi:hypothetical protein